MGLLAEGAGREQKELFKTYTVRQDLWKKHMKEAGSKPLWHRQDVSVCLKIRIAIHK